MIDIQQIEKELKKRLVYPYRWGRKQEDDWDSRTNFIYKTQNFDDFLSITEGFSQELRDYAMNRWYNFWSAMAVEKIFVQHSDVVANTNPYDKLIDFSIDGIPFDHKTSVFPKNFQHPINNALNDKVALIQWLYKNQSQQGRKHLKNRLFILLYETKNHQHWKLKSEIGELKKIIDVYMDSFSRKKLKTIHPDSEKVYSDIIWFLK
jgi:hypothetical protein